MSVQTIPNSTDEPYHTLRVRLDDQDYTLEFNYSVRGETYSLNLYDAEDALLVSGLKLFCWRPLLQWHKRDARVPRGEVVVTTLGSDRSPPGLGELGEGRRCELSYYPEADIRSILSDVAAARNGATETGA